MPTSTKKKKFTTKCVKPAPEPGSPKALAAEKLASSGLTLEDADRLGAKELGREEMINLLKKTGGPRQFGWAAGLHLPYFDEKGEPVRRPTEDGELERFYRVRGLGAGPYGEVPEIRYAQPKCLGTPVYLPQLVDWEEILADPNRRVVITEGELKASSACAHGIACVALGGVWNFKSKKAGVEFDPFLAKLAAGGRQVVIAFDTDAKPKPDVVVAQGVLAHRLAEAGAKVHIARLPPSGGKVGLDDFIVARGAEAAEQVIASAEEYEGQRVLHDLNKRYVLVQKPVCIYEHTTGSIHNETTFRMRERNKSVPSLDAHGKPTRMEANNAWLNWPERAEARAMVYAPGQPSFTADGAVNVWPGWGCEATKGDVSLWHELLDYVFQDAEPGAKQWFERWCAYPIQHPGAKLYSAPVFVSSDKGVGKSLIAELLGVVYGVKTAETNGTCTFIGRAELDSSFTEYLLGTSLVVCEEMTAGDYGSRRSLMDTLKNLITGQTVQINDKGVPRFSMSNRVNLIFNTNHIDGLAIEDKDRRFFVHQVTAPPMPISQGKRIADWGKRSAQGPAALRYHLEHLDLGDFEPQAPPPFTEAKGLMRDARKTELDQFAADLVERPEETMEAYAPTAGKIAKGCDLLTLRQVVEMYEAQKSGAAPSATDASMKKALLEARALRYPNNGAVRIPGHTVPRRLWAIRNVNEWRRRLPDEWGRHFADFFKNDDAMRPGGGRKY